MTPRERARDSYLKRTHGITSAEYDALLTNQDGRCAICRRLPAPGKHLAVDHCHTSGIVRGLLCGGMACNHRLGLVRDDANWCRAAADYLSASAIVAATSTDRKAYAGRITGKGRRKRIARATATATKAEVVNQTKRAKKIMTEKRALLGEIAAQTKLAKAIMAEDHDLLRDLAPLG